MTSASARPGDPYTSHLAASIVGKSKLEEDVFNFMRTCWPRYMTSIQIAAEMNIDKWSVSPRMKPLHDKGFLDDPVKLAGMNSSGKIRLLQHWRVKETWK